tara:strand:+ start:463 stop:786 length:324 start_codon:yes stop_codon:yes gene_type:complete
MDFDKDHFDVLRKVGKKSNLTQRKLASDLGFSIGKLNYCLKKLQNKGFIKIKNFKKNPNKLNYVYILTPKGITQKAKLTYNFMQRMMKEYDELKSELAEEKENVDNN